MKFGERTTMFNILDPICAPTKGSTYSAAIDLYARESVIILAGETAIIPLGISIDQSNLPLALDLNSHYLQLEPRSSLRAKGLQAGTGIIDIDFVPTCEKKQRVFAPCDFKEPLKE